MRTQVERLATSIPASGVTLEGDLSVPPDPTGAVVFALGSGSSRHSTRHRTLAVQLHEAGLATLLVDLLTTDEEALDARTAELRFDLDLLASRVAAAVSWLDHRIDLARLPLGLLGASTGTGAALIVAATVSSDRVGAVVSRGGRPDLAGSYLPVVRAPTLLIVGGRDDVVLELNRRALDAMTCPKRLEILSGATHLFEEPGSLEAVSALARGWFREHLVQGRRGGRTG